VADASISIIWGGVAAAAITATAALSSALISKRIKVSEFRQAWINALREDIATYLKEIDLMHHKINKLERTGSTTDDLDAQQEARAGVLLVYRRILLRLNMTEKPHIRLAELLEELLTIKTKTADGAKTAEIIKQAREVLRYEWAVTKYGKLAPFILWLRSCRICRHGLNI
jgi:hypothetical protein